MSAETSGWYLPTLIAPGVLLIVELRGMLLPNTATHPHTYFFCLFVLLALMAHVSCVLVALLPL